MRTSRIIFLTAAFAASIAQAQTKLDLELQNLVSRQQAETRNAPHRGGSASVGQSAKYIGVLARLESGAELPAAQLSELGAKVNGCYGSIVALSLPVSELQALAALPAFSVIERDYPMQVTCLKSRAAQHVDAVHHPSPADELPQGYTGRGVLVGVVDGGIDFNHNNFRDPVSHQTRIVNAIVYRGLNLVDDYNITDLEGNPVGPLSDYRYEYTDPAAIDTLTSDTYRQSHGTHTAGIAAGSYSGAYLNEQGEVIARDQHGMAPEADLILAGMSGEGATPASMLMDAVSAQVRCAEERQQPLTINVSCGFNVGWKDGKELFCQFCDELTENGSRPGLIICVAAGNEGGYQGITNRNHLSITLDDSNQHEYRARLQEYWSIFQETDNFTRKICLFSNDATPVDLSIEFWSRDNDACVDSLTMTTGQLIEAGLLSAGNYDNHDGRYACFFNALPEDGIMIPEDTYPVVVLRSQADCALHLSTYNADYSSALCYFDGETGDIMGSDNYSISDLACTNSVISIGGWQNCNSHQTYNGDTAYFPDWFSFPNDIAGFSSYCDADDNGVQRPDVCAPAVEVLSGLNSYDGSVWSDNQAVAVKVCGRADQQYLEGHTSLLGADSGTSMACPNACGVMALWLQADPTLSINEAREIIRASADQDEYTEGSPKRFGAGKLNALSGLQWILSNRPTSIRDLQASDRLTENLAPRKCLRQGQLVIEHRGSCFSLWGTQVK